MNRGQRSRQIEGQGSGRQRTEMLVERERRLGMEMGRIGVGTEWGQTGVGLV